MSADTAERVVLDVDLDASVPCDLRGWHPDGPPPATHRLLSWVPCCRRRWNYLICDQCVVRCKARRARRMARAWRHLDKGGLLVCEHCNRPRPRPSDDEYVITPLRPTS